MRTYRNVQKAHHFGMEGSACLANSLSFGPSRIQNVRSVQEEKVSIYNQSLAWNYQQRK